MPVVFFSGSITSTPAAPSDIEGTTAYAYLEATTTGNNSTSGNELTASTNRMATGPDGTTTSGQAPDYLSSQIDSKHAWVSDGTDEHIRLGVQAGQDQWLIGGGGLTMGLQPDSIGSSSFPRVAAVADKRYFNLFAGTSGPRLELYVRYSTTDWRVQSVNDICAWGDFIVLEIFGNTNNPGDGWTVRVDGAAIALNTISVGAGTVQAPASDEVLYFLNRRTDDSGTFFLNRGFNGKTTHIVPWFDIPSLADQKTALDEIAADRTHTVANPFEPSIEAQTLNVVGASGAGTSVGTPTVGGPAGQTITWSMTGNLTTFYSIDTSTGLISVKTGATAPATGTDTTGTVTVDNGVGTDDATITVTTVAASALKYTRPAWIGSITRTFTTSSGSSVQNITPNSNGEDIEILASSSSSMSRAGWRVQANGGDKFRNVFIRGGHYIGTDNASGGNDWVWRVQDNTGDIWFEGVRFTAGDRQDGVTLAPNNTSTDCYFQRCWWDRVNGPRSSPHGDFVQTRHKIGAIYADNWLGKAGYQGWFLDGRPGSDNANAEIHDTVVLTNGDVIRVDNVSSGGTPYGGPSSSGGGTQATGGFVFYMDAWPNGYRIGDASSRSTDEVWCEKFSGIYVGTETPTTPPNRMIRPGSGSPATLTSGGGDEWLVLSGDSEGFINVGTRPGGTALVEGPNVGQNFSERGSSTIIGGMGYTG